MQTNYQMIQTGTIEDFADRHGLVMEVNERDVPQNHPQRFYAAFSRAEVKDGAFLTGSVGNGSTPEAAIADYARRISRKLLVFNAYGENRKEIQVWRLTGEDT